MSDNVLQEYPDTEQCYHRLNLRSEESIEPDCTDVLPEHVAFFKNLQTSVKQAFETMRLPQREDPWKRARKGRLTGSVFGAAVGHNPYQTTNKLLKELLWSEFKGNAATEYGTEMEQVANKLYEEFKRKQRAALKMSTNGFRVEYPGLMLSIEHPFLATSPDGIVYEDGHRGLLEIKAPFGFNGNKKVFYNGIPPYYFDQIQGIMGLHGLEWCDFVTFTPLRISIERFAFDQVYFFSFLLPQLRNFYIHKYMPALVHQEKGLLKQGEINPVVEVKVDSKDMEDLMAKYGVNPFDAKPTTTRKRKSPSSEINVVQSAFIMKKKKTESIMQSTTKSTMDSNIDTKIDTNLKIDPKPQPQTMVPARLDHHVIATVKPMSLNLTSVSFPFIMKRQKITDC